MDNAILKKRLSSFRTEKGTLTRVSDDVLIDLLAAWENWAGTAKGFYGELGLSKMQLGGLMGKAKKLRRAGHMAEGEFKEIQIESSAPMTFPLGPCNGIEINWSEGKVIRFSQVDLLVDFLKKAA
jgi:hypothetical protein